MLAVWQKALLIVVINLIFYFRTLKYKYSSDDIAVAGKKATPRNKIQRFLWIIRGEKYFKPEEAHLYTMLIHAAISVCIYLGLGKNDISFLTALLFSLNPANIQVSIWLSGKGYAMVTLFILLGFTIPILSPIFVFMATRITNGFFTPLVFIGSKYWYLSLIAIPAWFINFKKFKKEVTNRMKSEQFTEDKAIELRKLVLVLKTYAFYFTIGLVPHKLSFYLSFLQSAAGNDIMRKRAYKKDFYFFLGISILVGGLIYNYFKWDNIMHGMLWFTIGILPYCNFRRLQQEVALRYIYFANIGLMYVLANLIVGYPIIITAFLVMYATRLWFIMPMFTDDYWLLEYSVADDPGAWFCWHARALKRIAQKSTSEAINMMVMAKLISPKEFKVLFNLACLLASRGKTKEAYLFLDEAEKNMVSGQEEESKKIIAEARSGKWAILI